MKPGHTTYQLRGYTTRAGYAAIDGVLADCAVLYNAALQEWRDAYRMAGKSITLYDQTRSLTEVRGDDPEGWGGRSLQIGRGVLRRLDRARKAFYRRAKAGEKPGYPRFKARRRWKTLEIGDPRPSMVRGGYVQVKGLPRIEVRPKRELPPPEDLKGLRLTRAGRKLIVNLTYEVKRAVGAPAGDCPEKSISQRDANHCGAGVGPKPDGADLRDRPRSATSCVGPKPDGADRNAHGGTGSEDVGPEPDGADQSTPRAISRWLVGPEPDGADPTMVGIDMGVSDRVALSTGETIPRRDVDRGRIEEAQRRRGRCRKGSREWRRRTRVIANLHYKSRIRNRNEAHRITTAIVRRFDLIAVEDLQIGNMMRSAAGTVEEPGRNVAAKSGLNRSIAEQTWGIILAQLSYKAEWAGRTLVEVDPRHTSQTCSRCGTVDAGARREKRYHCNACGLDMDADHNAAVNILHKALLDPHATHLNLTDGPGLSIDGSGA